MDWTALALTARLACCATLGLLLLGLPLAWWLASTRWRGRIFIEALVALPLVLPPTVLGFYLLLCFAPGTWAGGWWVRIAGSALPFSFSGLLLASVLYSLPFAVQPFTAAFRGLDPALLEAARTLGASAWRAWWRIALPLAWPGILSGAMLSFAHTVGEFGVVLMVGGNLPGRTRTISLAIYDEVQALDYAQAARHSLVLMAFSLAVLSAAYALQRGSLLRLGEAGKGRR